MVEYAVTHEHFFRRRQYGNYVRSKAKARKLVEKCKEEFPGSNPRITKHHITPPRRRRKKRRR